MNKKTKKKRSIKVSQKCYLLPFDEWKVCPHSIIKCITLPNFSHSSGMFVVIEIFANMFQCDWPVLHVTHQNKRYIWYKRWCVSLGKSFRNVNSCAQRIPKRFLFPKWWANNIVQFHKKKKNWKIKWCEMNWTDIYILWCVMCVCVCVCVCVKWKIKRFQDKCPFDEIEISKRRN